MDKHLQLLVRALAKEKPILKDCYYLTRGTESVSMIGKIYVYSYLLTY